MSEKNTTIIKLAEIIAPIITSRDIVSNLEKLIKKAPTVNVALDFSNVQFVSRSAAHQLLVIKEKIANRLWNKKIIFFINTNDDVMNMLRLVAASKALPKKRVIKFDTEVVDIQSLIAQSQ